MGDRERLPADEQIANARQCLRILVDDGVEQRCRQPQTGDALAIENPPEIAGTTRTAAGRSRGARRAPAGARFRTWTSRRTSTTAAGTRLSVAPAGSRGPRPVSRCPGAALRHPWAGRSFPTCRWYTPDCSESSSHSRFSVLWLRDLMKLRIDADHLVVAGERSNLLPPANHQRHARIAHHVRRGVPGARWDRAQGRRRRL